MYVFSILHNLPKWQEEFPSLVEELFKLQLMQLKYILYHRLKALSEVLDEPLDILGPEKDVEPQANSVIKEEINLTK